MEEIGREVRKRVGGEVPLVKLARGASCGNGNLIKAPEHNVLAIDGSIDRLTIQNEFSSKNNVVLQGDFSPKESTEKDESINKEMVKKAAAECLSQLGPVHLIANLGE